MKNKSLINLIILLFLIIAVVVVIRNQKSNSTDAFRKNQSSHFVNTGKPKGYFFSDPKDINRHPKGIQYSKHAKCRMECRHLDESEVNEILQTGEINYKKSNDRPQKCPTYALEGKTHDGQQTRMVFSFCGPEEVTLVTVIDLDTDWKCNCF